MFQIGYGGGMTNVRPVAAANATADSRVNRILLNPPRSFSSVTYRDSPRLEVASRKNGPRYSLSLRREKTRKKRSETDLNQASLFENICRIDEGR